MQIEPPSGRSNPFSKTLSLLVQKLKIGHTRKRNDRGKGKAGVGARRLLAPIVAAWNGSFGIVEQTPRFLRTEPAQGFAKKLETQATLAWVVLP